MRITVLARLGIIGILGLGAAGPVSAACKVGKIAELPVTIVNNRAIVEAKFGPHPTQFIVDSGAFYSLLSRSSAAEFGLLTAPAPFGFTLRGVNGGSAASVAQAKDFTLAGILIPRVSFFVGGSDTGTAGVLGQNILGLADVEYDFPHGAVRLMSVEGCGTKALAYWSAGKPFSTIPLDRGGGGLWKPHTIGTVLVNGVKMRAVFDTGAQGTTMTLAAAKRAGITPESPGVKAVGLHSGIGANLIPTWLAPFDTIDLGGEIVPHPHFHIADMQFDGDILIGFDFFLTHRIFVSNANHQLYMTYEGGSLFGLTPTGARTVAGARLDLTDKAPDPVDAEGFSRRGTVSISRRKFAEGIADLDKAVALSPNDGRYVYLRAQARVADHQLAPAMADLDKAAALMPEDAEVRLLRARIRAGRHDLTGAQQDIEVADHVLPAGSDKRLALADLYLVIDKPDAAIPNFDAWLKLHGQDAGRASAYNGRCWARALLDRELERALSDCNTAIRLLPGESAYLDSRALVQLRLGKLDAALLDYDAALKAGPPSAWSLYARAIVEKRMGKSDAAAADRKAALAINDRVAERADNYGIDR